MTRIPGAHLTPEDLDAWLAGALAPAAQDHLAGCPTPPSGKPCSHFVLAGAVGLDLPTGKIMAVISERELEIAWQKLSPEMQGTAEVFENEHLVVLLITLFNARNRR